MRILPIASGKGGVGKSLTSANLAIVLGQSGKRVVLADLDLGASNLHTILGLPAPKYGIGSFLSDNSPVTFEEIILPTDYKNLSFIPGDAEIPGLANIKASQKNLLIRKLLSLNCDYLILDLGAGTSTMIIDFFLMSGQGIIITTPVLTATLNAYSFLKNVIFRIIFTVLGSKSPAYKYLDELRKDGVSLQKTYIPALMEEVEKLDPTKAAIIYARLAKFQPRLIMNMIEDPKDAEKAKKIQSSCRSYLGITLEHLGILYRDDLQDASLKGKIPITRYKPDSILAQGIYRLGEKLIAMEHLADEGGLLSQEDAEESFRVAEMEAEQDFGAKVAYVEELASSGALSMGDILELVRSQQFEINKLRRENVFLKTKIVKAIEAGFIN